MSCVLPLALASEVMRNRDMSWADEPRTLPAIAGHLRAKGCSLLIISAGLLAPDTYLEAGRFHCWVLTRLIMSLKHFNELFSPISIGRHDYAFIASFNLSSGLKSWMFNGISNLVLTTKPLRSSPFSCKLHFVYASYSAWCCSMSTFTRVSV